MLLVTMHWAETKRDEWGYVEPAEKLWTFLWCGGIEESFCKFSQEIFPENVYEPKRSQNSSEGKLLGH